MVEGALCAARCHEHGNGTKVDLYKAEYLYQRVRPFLETCSVSRRDQCVLLVDATHLCVKDSEFCA